jgi:uncharacterized membrane protein YgcG
VNLRALLLALIALVFATPALATERINLFDVAIKAELDGDIVVTETLNVRVEGNEIRRGIFRDLPRFYTQDGARYHYDYDILSIQRDDGREDYDTETEGNAYRIIIGDEDVLLDHGDHTYVIRYRVKNQIRYFPDHDELYWNVTGNYWNFPIAQARATISLPRAVTIREVNAFTGGEGQSGSDFTATQAGERQIFNTTRPLAVREGLTISIAFDKGVIEPPSAGDIAGLWWQRFGSLTVLGVSMLGLFFWLYRGFNRVGRDPTKGPVFPRYEAPEGYSPAGVHYVYNRGGPDSHRALIATLMNLAVKGRIIVDATDKKRTELTRNASSTSVGNDGIAPEDLAFETNLFVGSNHKVLGGAYDSGFTTAYTSYTKTLGEKYGEGYFRWNIGYTLTALAISIIVVAAAAFLANEWTIWLTFGLVALAALNILFMYLMPAPTDKGQKLRTEIEGFKLYMETAEKLQLNAVTPGSDTPPPMTTERYEKFLPYAVALGVEKPWTKHFQNLIPNEAATYNPTWTHMNVGAHSFASLSDSMVSNISSGVSSSLPQSSSSSGSGGGGSSGGGGGGGGGGGW